MLTLNRRACHSYGFSLIELMIVVAIIAVLMTIALPAYQQQSMRATRAAAQAEMLTVANLQEQYLLANRQYLDAAGLLAAGYTPDPVVARHYQTDMTLATGPVPAYALRLVPFGAQQADGWLQVDSQGNFTSEFDDRWFPL